MRRTSPSHPTPTPPTARESGHALLLSLFALLLLATATALVYSVVLREQRTVLDGRARMELRAMNDAAVAETLAALADQPGFGGVAEHELGAGRIRSEIERLTATRSRIHAVAELGGRTRETELTIVRQSSRWVVVHWTR